MLFRPRVFLRRAVSWLINTDARITDPECYEEEECVKRSTKLRRFVDSSAQPLKSI